MTCRDAPRLGTALALVRSLFPAPRRTPRLLARADTPHKTFGTLKELKAHLAQVHRLHFCDICLEGRKVGWGIAGAARWGRCWGALRDGGGDGGAGGTTEPPLPPLPSSPAHSPLHATHTHTCPPAHPTNPPQVFVSEQELYSKAELERHQRGGDTQGPMALAGFKGHPECR